MVSKQGNAVRTQLKCSSPVSHINSHILFLFKLSCPLSFSHVREFLMLTFVLQTTESMQEDLTGSWGRRRKSAADNELLNPPSEALYGLNQNKPDHSKMHLPRDYCKYSYGTAMSRCSDHLNAVSGFRHELSIVQWQEIGDSCKRLQQFVQFKLKSSL